MKVEYLITQHWYNGAKIERSSLYDFPNLDKTKQRVYKITNQTDKATFIQDYYNQTFVEMPVVCLFVFF